MVSEQLVEKFCQGVAFAEGFGKPNALPTRCHNPGDLTDDGDVGFGTARSIGIGAADITVYASDADGWNALRKKIRRALEGRSKEYPTTLTIEQMGWRYSRDENWGRNVASKLGVGAETTLEQLVAKDPDSQALSWPNA